jgi:hypothetical protein
MLLVLGLIWIFGYFVLNAYIVDPERVSRDIHYLAILAGLVLFWTGALQIIL